MSTSSKRTNDSSPQQVISGYRERFDYLVTCFYSFLMFGVFV